MSITDEMQALYDKWNNHKVIIINESHPSFQKVGTIHGTGNSIRGARIIITLQSGQKVYADEIDIVDVLSTQKH